MENKKNIKLWGEHVNFPQFIIGLIISISILLISLFVTAKLAPDNKSLKLIVGLISVLVSFIINLIWIKPKRNIIVKDVKNNDI